MRIAMRRSTDLRAEAASEAEAVDTGLPVQILRAHQTLDRSIEKSTRTLYGSVVVWETRLADLAIAAAPQRVRQPCDDRHADRVCRVPVGVVSMPVKRCPQPLEPGIWLVGEKKVRTSHPQTFALLYQHGIC